MRDKVLINERAHLLVNLTTEFCEKYLDDEYTELCEKLIRKMSRKRNVPFLSGRIEIWAAAILYALGQINFFFEDSYQQYTSRDELCAFFNVNKSTVSQKAKKIRDMFKLTYWDDDFSTEQNRGNDPFSNFVMVNGFIVPKDILVEMILEEGLDESMNMDFIERDGDREHPDVLPMEGSTNRSLRLVGVDKDSWRFEEPMSAELLDEELYDGVSLLDEGMEREAEKVFRTIIEEFPQHIDAYHHLAIACDRRGKKKEALQLWETAVEIGRNCFPEDFSMGTSRLEWGWLENRPFLRACQGLGLAYLERGEIRKSLEIFKDMVSMNPNDNQGIRGLVIETCFMLKKPGEVLKVCDQYPDDAMSDTLYGRPLALIQLGKTKDSEKAMKEAIKYLPLVGKELMKRRHRRPKDMTYGCVTMGGADEAFEYWERYGAYWKETSGAIEFIEKCMTRIP